jgi:cyclase
MLTKRIIPCLDVRDGRVTKGVQFLANIDVGDPVAMARYYYEEGADEIVFYDITASNERRAIMLEVVRAVASEIFIPFSVGGGLRTVEDMRAVLLAGAEKVSVDSGAVRNPRIIAEGARAFGSQCIVLSMQVKRRMANPQFPSGYEVMIDGGRTPTGRDAVEWAHTGQSLGAGELCINSIDRDGTKLGYDLEITRRISESVSIPVIA